MTQGSRVDADGKTTAKLLNPWLLGMAWFGGASVAFGGWFVVAGRGTVCPGNDFCTSDWSEISVGQLFGLVLILVGCIEWTAAAALSAYFWQARRAS